MKLLQFVPIKLTLCLILGILLGYYFRPSIGFSLLLTLSALVILAALFYRGLQKKVSLFGLLTATTTICIGILSTALWSPVNYADHYSNSTIEIEGSWHLKIHEVMKPTAFSSRYIAQVQGLENRKASGKVLLRFPLDSTSTVLKVDDELIVIASAKAIDPPLNPHQFNYKNYLQILGISHQLNSTTARMTLAVNPSLTLNGMAEAFRNKIITKLRIANFGDEQLGIIQALLLGQRDDISEDIYNNYKNAGAVHILAVSGLHIGILLLLLQFLLRPLEYLPKGKTIKLAATVLLLWGFAFLAGLSASVVRAVTMFTFVAYAMYLNRPGNTFNILALSMFFILLLYNPMLLFQVGFQMSYAAVFFIVWLYPLLQKLWNPKHWLVRKVWQLLSVSIAAQLGVLPISLFYFHQFPGLFFVSNLLIVPFLGIVLGVGILVIVLSLVNSLPDFLVKFYDSFIGLMNDTIAWVAQHEAFVFQNIPFDSVQLVLSYALIINFTLMVTKATFKRTAAVLTLLIGFQLWVFYTTYKTERTVNLLLAHQNRNTILMHQTGNRLSISTNDKSVVERMATDYRIAERITSVGYHDIKNAYDFKNRKIMLIDSLGVYSSKGIAPDFLLLTHSPKINLERLIDSLRPKTLIADGSNYRSYVNRWKITCAKRKLPFHYTGEKGAYYFDLGD